MLTFNNVCIYLNVLSSKFIMFINQSQIVRFRYNVFIFVTLYIFYTTLIILKIKLFNNSEQFISE